MENRIRLIAPATLMPSGVGEFGCEVFDDMAEGLKDCDVVMMLRLQKERMDGGFIPSEREYYHRYGLDAEKLAHAKPDAIVMHPGPMNRGVEIDGTLADDINRSVIQDQVEMGVAVRMACMDLLARNLKAERGPSGRRGDGMSDALTLPRGERHVLRVFALDMDKAEVERLRNRPSGSDPLAQVDPALRHADPARVAALFGLSEIDPAEVEIVDTDDLSDLGLAAYLIEGDAAAESQIAADRDRLDALRGHVLTLRSAAVPTKPVTLHPVPALTLVGTYAEDVPPVRFDPLPSDSARGSLKPRGQGPVEPARGGKGLWLLAAAVLFFVLLVVLKFRAG